MYCYYCLEKQTVLAHVYGVGGAGKWQATGNPAINLPSPAFFGLSLRISDAPITKRHSIIAPNLHDNFPEHPNSAPFAMFFSGVLIRQNTVANINSLGISCIIFLLYFCFVLSNQIQLLTFLHLCYQKIHCQVAQLGKRKKVL